MEREVKAAVGEFPFQLSDSRLEHRPGQIDRQFVEAELEQFLVAQFWPVGRNRARHGGSYSFAHFGGKAAMFMAPPSHVYVVVREAGARGPRRRDRYVVSGRPP